MTRAWINFLLVGFALAAVLGAVLVVLWWKTDTRLRQLQAWAAGVDDWLDEQFGGPEPQVLVDGPEPDPEPAEAGGADTVIAHPASSAARRTELLRARPSPTREPDLSRFSFDPDGRRHG